MRALFFTVILTIALGIFSVQAQAVKYGNNETSDYGSSYKSGSYTYLMWDLNDNGGGNFSNYSTPKFFYWDNDDSQFHYLIDTGNMSQLDASFRTINFYYGSGRQIDNVKTIDFYIDDNNENRNAIALQLENPFGKIGNKEGTAIEFLGDDDVYGAIYSQGNGSSNSLPALKFAEFDEYHFDDNVGIGTTSPSAKLAVNGTARAEEVIVEENVGADFVFEDDYILPDLKEIETYIQKHKHLPEIPTAGEMIENGIKVGDLQMKLLQKIEELTLYIIEQQKTIKNDRQTLNNQKQIIKSLTKRVKELEENIK